MSRLLDPSAGVLADGAAPPAVVPEADGSLPPPDSRRVIRRGSTGDEVRYAQERLNAHGAEPELDTDAIFGPLTQKACRAYQRTHGLMTDAVIGRHTWASLDGPTVIGGKSGSGPGGSGAGNAVPGAIKYDTAHYTITPPAPKTKLADMQAQVAAKQAAKPPDLGKTVSVTGVTAGTDEEIFVWNVLVQLGTASRWGTEVDLVTAIGRPSKATNNQTPMGQVTLVIDHQGNATTQLLARGPVAAPAAFNDIDAARKALIADFGFSAVKDGSATWTLAELNKVHAALLRLPAADRAALKDVDLVREHTLANAAGEPLTGLFSHDFQLATGATKPTRTQSLSLADSAFSGDDVSFIGDTGTAAVGSFQTILHEAGHAVETKAKRDAGWAKLEAMGKFNEATTAMNKAIAAFNPAQTAAFAAAKGYTKPQQASASSYMASINAVTTALNQYGSNTKVDKHAGLEKAVSTAITKRDAAKAALAKKDASHPALADFAATSSAQDDWFKAAKERATAHTDQKNKEDAEKAVMSGNISKRLKNFVDLVNKHKIPPLTDYAARNWPGHPEEFFAEAYSLWLNDRVYLTANARPLVDWFDAGGHRQ